MSVCRRLVGKVAVVTGSTAGIGLAIARRLGQEGAKVVVSSRKEANVSKTVDLLQSEGHTVSGTVCNVALEEDREALFQHVEDTYGGQLDILVSNVGVNPAFGPILSCPEKAWNKIMSSNVVCSALLASQAVPMMEENSSIVFVSSVTGFVPALGIGPYSVSKAALMSLTKGLAAELSHEGIRVNCIAPGIITTDFSNALTTNPQISETVMQMIPMKRFGTAEECSGAVAFLVSDDASYITGETVSMDGGMPVRF